MLFFLCNQMGWLKWIGQENETSFPFCWFIFPIWMQVCNLLSLFCKVNNMMFVAIINWCLNWKHFGKKPNLKLLINMTFWALGIFEKHFTNKGFYQILQELVEMYYTIMWHRICSYILKCKHLFSSLRWVVVYTHNEL